MVAYDTYSSDDEEEQCPLCIEDMDITDKHFKPCPCGFQICQFCFNNIRSGPDQYNRCPACRRPYDDASIEYKKFSPEDLKREQERKQRKEAERKQREREKQKDQAHHDIRDKKHLASMRVIQKNLVYVIGLNPSIPSEEMQAMLRRDEFFGQYGKIQKIVVNKRVNGNGNPGVGVYVTFARKEDAARCIAAVDGSINDGKYLRAAYGTTKYCSSYLRGQNCPNPNCMFLHEPGEEADSFNRHPNSAAVGGGSTSNSAGNGVSAPQSTGASISPQVAHSQTSSPAQVEAVAHHQALPSTAPASGLGGGTAGSTTGAGGATLMAANAPALPAWGKVTPQIPSVAKLTEGDLSGVSRESLHVMDVNLTQLAAAKWDFEFVSDLLDANTKFPPMFSLPMEDKRRLKVFNKAISELDKLSPSPYSAAGSGASTPMSMSGSTPAPMTATSGSASNNPHISASNTPINQGPMSQALDRVPDDRVTGTPVRSDSRMNSTPGSRQMSMVAGSSPRSTEFVDLSSGTVESRRGSSATAVGINTPTKSETKKNNSQHLLAHLMRNASAAAETQPLDRQDEDVRTDSKPDRAEKRATSSSSDLSKALRRPGLDENEHGSPDRGQAEARTGLKDLISEHAPASKAPPPKLDLTAALSLLNARQETPVLNSQFAETLRRVGGDLMQPANPVTVHIDDNYEFPKGQYVDDGPSFDLRNIPRVELSGDVEPSVWSAIEIHTRLKDQATINEKAFSTAKAQTKKRVKKIRT